MALNFPFVLDFREHGLYFDCRKLPMHTRVNCD